MKFKINLTAVFLLSMLTLSACTKKPKSFGGETQLYVIADEQNWTALEPTLREVFEKVIQTPQPEKVFEVQWVPQEEFSGYAARKNLLLIGILESEGEINGKVTGMLAPEVLSRVKDGSAFYFPKEDAWAEGQILVVTAGTSTGQLEEKLRANKDFLYELFEKKLLEETQEKMYHKLEQTELAEKLLDDYGWTVRVQHDYIINIDRGQDRFVMLRRSLPGRERWLFVHWIDAADPAVLEGDWMIRTRNKLTAKFYEGDRINEKFTSSRTVDFLGHSTVMLQGLWENEEKGVGGPFRSYSFYDETSGRLYIIDIAVYFPRGLKEPFLRQLDVMAHTFKTADLVNKGIQEAS